MGFSMKDKSVRVEFSTMVTLDDLDAHFVLGLQFHFIANIVGKGLTLESHERCLNITTIAIKEGEEILAVVDGLHRGWSQNVSVDLFTKICSQ